MGKPNFSDEFKRDTVAQITEREAGMGRSPKKSHGIWIEAIKPIQHAMSSIGM